MLMIELYLGSVGSGKTYHAVQRGLYNISGIPDKYTIANFPIKIDFDTRDYKWWQPVRKIRQYLHNKKMEIHKRRWIYLDNDEMTVDKLIEISIKYKFIGKESSALLIIDEAGIKFNSRDWNIKPNERKKWIKFFSQCRKFGYDVVLVAQDERMIDRQIRAAAEYKVMHRMANRFSFFKLLPFKLFFYVYFWNGGNFRGKLELAMLNKKVANRYDTMRLFDVDNIIRSVTGKTVMDS